jgi:hypothetical protein
MLEHFRVLQNSDESAAISWREPVAEDILQETSRSASRVARNALLDLHVLELVDKNPNVFAVIDWNGDQVQPAKGKCLLQRRY